jgi:hypothetical protein
MFCQNKDAKPETTATEILTAGPWIEAEHWSDFDKNGVFELELWPTCVNDDSWTFLSNQTIEHRDLGELCDTSISPILYTGTWQLQNNEQTVYIEYDPDFLFSYYKIADFNDSMIELWIIDPDQPSAQVTEKVILRKQ